MKSILVSSPMALMRALGHIRKATPALIDQAMDLPRLTSRASELFRQQPAAGQCQSLQVAFEKATWHARVLRTTLFEPFEISRHSNQDSFGKEKEKGGSGRDLGIWLPKRNKGCFTPERQCQSY